MVHVARHDFGPMCDVCAAPFGEALGEEVVGMVEASRLSSIVKASLIKDRPDLLVPLQVSLVTRPTHALVEAVHIAVQRGVEVGNLLSAVSCGVVSQSAAGG